MSDNILEPTINGLPPVTDWQKVFLALQQANEAFLRGATLTQLGKQIIGDVAIQGADYEDLPVATTTDPVPLPIPEANLKYGFLANGKYSQPNGPTLEYSSKQWGLTLFDGEKWVKKFTLELPEQKLDVEGGALSFEKGKLLEENKANTSYEGNINLFDNTNYADNKFFSYIDVGHSYEGIATDAEGWFISTPIAAKAGKKYIKNHSSIGFFDTEDVMIAAFPASTETSVIAPAGTVSLRITAQKISLNDVMVVEGTEIPGYESGQKKVSLTNLPTEISNRWKNTVIVSKFGGQFDTINKALDFIDGKDNFINRWVILLMPGSYVESVNLIGRYITLFGYDKETTIVRTYTNDYYNPPLDCAGNNNVYNVTVIADDDGQTTPPAGVGNMPAYALHFDTSGRYEHLGSRIQGRAVFENVRFISHHQHAAGIGLSQSQHLVFEQCEFFSYEKPAFRAHNYLPSGATDQKMIVKDCLIHNKYGVDMWPIMLQDPNNAVGGKDNVDTIFQFIQNVAYYDDNDSSDLLYVNTPLVPGAITGKILLGRGSFGNNIAALNK